MVRLGRRAGFEGLAGGKESVLRENTGFSVERFYSWTCGSVFFLGFLGVCFVVGCGVCESVSFGCWCCSQGFKELFCGSCLWAFPEILVGRTMRFESEKEIVNLTGAFGISLSFEWRFQ